MGGSGSGGHNRKTNGQHQVTGTWRPDRHGTGYTLADAVIDGRFGSVGRCPTWIRGEGRKLWREIRAELEPAGVLCSLDRSMFELLCATWGNLRAATKTLAEEGLTYRTTKGVVKPHPALRIESQCRTAYIGLARCFGLMDGSRKRLPAAKPNAEADPFASLLNGTYRN